MGCRTNKQNTKKKKKWKKCSQPANRHTNKMFVVVVYVLGVVIINMKIETTKKIKNKKMLEKEKL